MENEEHVVYGCFHIVHLEFWEKLKSAMKYIFGKKHKDSDFDALFNFAFKSSTLRSAALRLLILLLIDFSKQATE